jgi:hypothetical protein
MKNFGDIKMHGATIKKNPHLYFTVVPNISGTV